MTAFTATDPVESRNGLLMAPEHPEDWPAWRTRLQAWRAEGMAAGRIGRPLYDRRAQAWASRTYVQGMVMLWDRRLIDHTTHAWTVDRLLDEAEREVGGFDVVVLWSNYPLSGLDGRNQLEWFEDLPGGLDGLAAAVAGFHRRGVRVMIDHKPWVPGLPAGLRDDAEGFARLVARCGLDGIYLDCSNGPSDRLREALAEVGTDKAFCSEAPARPEPFGHEIQSWQQNTDDGAAPAVYRNRWLDRDHLVFETRRYHPDPWREIQRAWMNGGGLVVWENVFGYYARYGERARSWIRLVAPALRRFSGHFISGDWQPHVGGATFGSVYVSRFDHAGTSLWTVANRRAHAIEKTVLRLPYLPGHRYVDVITGREFALGAVRDGQIELIGRLEREGVAGVLAVPAVDAGLAEFLAVQRGRFAQAELIGPAWLDEHCRTVASHALRAVAATTRAAAPPSGMLRIPDWEGELLSRYRMRECGHIAGTPGELHVYDAFEKPCTDRRPARVAAVAIDEVPVSNADFARFLRASGWRPAVAHRFLAHWIDGTPPPGQEDHPVVHVSLSDARAYAAWAGRRLPREEEWQRAALGPGGACWPWGAADDPVRRTGAETGRTTPVRAHPDGRSAIGAWDMCGNVWELTESERDDGFTRYALLKGGCHHQGQGSFWLFDGDARPADWVAKQILLWDGMDRCSTVGFRCACDLEG
jgi:hypothetical protein